MTALVEVTEGYVNEHMERPKPMTVATLIKKLNTCEPDKPVRLIVDGFNLMDMPHFGVTESDEDVCLGRFDMTAYGVEELPE